MNQSILGIAYPKRPRYLMATVETTSIGPCKPDPKMMCQYVDVLRVGDVEVVYEYSTGTGKR